MRLLLGFLFWCIYFPLIRLLALLLFWNDKVEQRERFEKKNKFEFLAHSFSEIGIEADLCFEFSSEGEYQQVAPLIDDAIKAGKRVELIFFSPSVEKTIMKLASLHPTQVRYLRYPIVRLFPYKGRRSLLHWVTAKTMILVRYDLFPDLLLWGMKKGHTLKMVWMTFKKEGQPSFWKKLFLKNAKTVVYARSLDQKTGESINPSGLTYDFRIEQIGRRLSRRMEKFQTHFSLYEEFKKFNTGKSLILGNAWPEDLFLLKDIPADTYVVVVPHDLSEGILQQFREKLKDRDMLELSDRSTTLSHHRTLLLNKKGILCELYADFQFAYVGGGFGVSVHSVLEPFVAGSENISCGPRHHRSTEYDIALDAKRITEINTPEQFAQWFNSPMKTSAHDRLGSENQDYMKARELVISC